MRDRDRDLLEDEEAGSLREAYSQMKRAANAAGYNTADIAVQVALIHSHAVMSFAGSVTNAIERVADELRRVRRGTYS